MKTLYITILILLLMLFSSFSKTSTTGPIPLEATRWELINIYTATNSQPVLTGKAFLRFDLQKGSVGGNGSCNSFGGQYAAQGDSISISHIFSTKMYCEGVQPIENTFLQLLEEADWYAIKENKLYLYSKDKLLLIFEAKAA